MIKLTAFSQKDTVQTKCFTIPVVKSIMVDLISGDSIKDILHLTEQQLLLTEQKLTLKDSVNYYLNEKNVSCDSSLRIERKKYDELFNYTKIVENNYNTVSLKLDVANTKNKVKNWVIGGGFTIAIGYTAFYFLFMNK